MIEYRHFKVVNEKGVTVVHLVEPRLFDTLIVRELEDELLDMLDKQKPQKLLVDFDGVTHCSTAVINSLLRAKKRLLASDGQIGLCSMCDTIRDAYRLLNLDGTVFTIYDNRTRGIAAMTLAR